MATDEERLRDRVIEKATTQIPRGFLIEYQERARRAYSDVFAEVQQSPTTLSEQRLFKLNQDRCFRMDWELYGAATNHGLNATAKPLSENNWHHVYVTTEGFGLTQSYVQRLGELPQPARFRERLAEAARCPRLPLDDPEEIYTVKSFYALLAHNPIGRRFELDEQRLGSIVFCVPNSDMKSWAVEISLPELIAHYPAAKPEIKEDRGPTWKRQEVRGTGTK